MEKVNKKILIIFAGFVFLFLGLVLYMTYFQVVKAKDLNNGEYSKYNPRNTVDENKVKRGTVYDSDGNILIETKTDSDKNNYRSFPYGEDYAPITGYNSKSYGTYGLEQSFSNQLLNIKEDTPLAELKKLVEKQDRGNDLKLTTNTELQKIAMDELNGKKGSIVAMNPKTGAIYAMASFPSYNPNEVTAEWQDIIADDKSGRLLNRATQGVYVPGSVFKIITATSILDNQDKLETLTINDKGKTKVGGYEIKNIYEMVNGQTDLKKALVYSSNVYFAELGAELGRKTLEETTSKFYIGEKFDFDLKMSNSKNGYSEDIDTAGVAATSFGQGKTLVTPLNMAMAMSAIANNGQMMQPYIVDQIISPDKKVKQTEPKVLSTVTSEENAHEIMEDLVAVVRNGSNAAISGVKVAGKSGTAEIGKDKESTNAWFISAAPADDATVAVAVVLEESGEGGDDAAGPIARRIMSKALNLGLGSN